MSGNEISSGDLAAGLRGWARGRAAHEQAAVELLIWHQTWLRRPDFTGACITQRAPGLVAILNWYEAREFINRGFLPRGASRPFPASSSQRRLLDFAVALGENMFGLPGMGIVHRWHMAAAFAGACGHTLLEPVPGPGLREDLGRAEARIGDLEDETGQLRRQFGGVLVQIRVLDRLRPTCVLCRDQAADRQTVRGPACTDCVGDLPDDGADPDRPETWAFAEPPLTGPQPDDEPGVTVVFEFGDEDQAGEPEPEEYDPGPEIDDEGGMSEYRYTLPEDYQRGQS